MVMLMLVVNVTIHTVLHTIGGEHRSRGRYDNLWSVLRPGQIGPLHMPLNVCKVCVCMSDVLQLLV